MCHASMGKGWDIQQGPGSGSTSSSTSKSSTSTAPSGVHYDPNPNVQALAALAEAARFHGMGDQLGGLFDTALSTLQASTPPRNRFEQVEEETEDSMTVAQYQGAEGMQLSMQRY